MHLLTVYIAPRNNSLHVELHTYVHSQNGLFVAVSSCKCKLRLFY